MSAETNDNAPDFNSKAPSREVIIGIALVAPILLGLLLRSYLMPDGELSHQGRVGNNALMLVGSANTVQVQNTDTITKLDDSQIQVPQRLLGQ
jgi:hypothetical protein